MWFPERIRHVSTVDIQPALEALDKLDEAVWSADEKTKKRLAGDRPTQSLFFYSMTREMYASIIAQRPLEQDDVPKLQAYDLLYEDFSYLFDVVQQFYPRGGVFLRAQVARMPAGGTIKEHRDSLLILENSHRLHIPLITTKKLKFVVDNQRVFLEAGHLYELNNQLPHWVENPEDSIDRTHLILDYLPPEYNVPISTDECFKFFIREHRAGRSRKPSQLSVDPPCILALVSHERSSSKPSYALHLVDFEKKSSEKIFDFAELKASSNTAVPGGVAVSEKSIVISFGDTLHLLSKKFKYQKSFSSPLLKDASGLSCDRNHIYVASEGTDAVLRFDLRKHRFDMQWKFDLDNQNKVAVRKERIETGSVPEARASLGIHCVEVKNRKMLVAGKSLGNLIEVNDEAFEVGSQIPLGTTNFVNYTKGVGFVSKLMRRVVYMTNYDYRAVICDSGVSEDGKLIGFPTSIENSNNYAGGLRKYHKGTVIVGKRPASVALLDMKSQSALLEIEIDSFETSEVLDLEIFC